VPEALTPGLTPADKALLASFGLTEAQKARVWAAWQASPDGLELVALRAREEGKRGGTSGAGLLLHMIARGDHLLEQNPNAPRVTGYRFVRSTASGRYVRDPAGTDPLPIGYEAPR
jgi:peptidoglycan/xylan/chitin deacetylase (PgdA/CDA1 family)